MLTVITSTVLLLLIDKPTVIILIISIISISSMITKPIIFISTICLLMSNYKQILIGRHTTKQ